MAFKLPEGWTNKESKSYGTIITAPHSFGGGGSVTVDEGARNFDLGIVVVRKRGNYGGRGWKEQLHNDAVEALKSALSR